MAHVGPRPDGEPGALVRLEEIEVEVLRSVVRQLLDLIKPDEDEEIDPLARLVGIDPHAAPSSDPALRRLLPDAFIDDEEASAEFRRFTERDLRDRKVRHAQAVLADLNAGAGGGAVLLDREGVWSWLGMLNDARLVLGERLQLTEENHDELADLPEDDPRASLMGLYGWLTYLQESLVQEALEPPSR